MRSRFARVFARVLLPFGGEKHMGFLLGGEQKCRLADFGRKRKVCGATSERKVPTRGFSAKKETVWCDLSAIFTRGFSAKRETMWRDLLCAKNRYKNKTWKSVYYTYIQCIQYNIYMPNPIIVQTVDKFRVPLVKCLAHRLDGLFSFG